MLVRSWDEEFLGNESINSQRGETVAPGPPTRFWWGARPNKSSSQETMGRGLIFKYAHAQFLSPSSLSNTHTHTHTCMYSPSVLLINISRVITDAQYYDGRSEARRRSAGRCWAKSEETFLFSIRLKNSYRLWLLLLGFPSLFFLNTKIGW